MNEQTQLVLYPSADRQPMEFDGGVRDVVSRSKAAHEPRGSVNDPLQRCDGAVRQTGEQSVDVVESCQHERCHDVGGDITTEQTPNLTQMSQLEEASLRHLGHVCLHTQTAVMPRSRTDCTGCMQCLGANDDGSARLWQTAQ